MSDKRRCHRHNVDLPVSFKFHEGQKHISIANTINVSAIGICMLSKEKFFVGQEFSMKVKLPSGETITVNVDVVRVDESIACGAVEYKVGLRLSDDMKDDEKKFVKYCADIMIEEYEERQGKKKDTPQ